MPIQLESKCKHANVKPILQLKGPEETVNLCEDCGSLISAPKTANHAERFSQCENGREADTRYDSTLPRMWKDRFRCRYAWFLYQG